MEEYRYHRERVGVFVQRVVVLSQKGYRYSILGEIWSAGPRTRSTRSSSPSTRYGSPGASGTYRKPEGLPNGHYFSFNRR